MRRELHIKRLSLYLVLVQFGSLLYLLVTGPLIADTTLLRSIEGIGVFIGLTALFNMGVTNVSINPIPKSDAKLKIQFLYKYIRHPMYLGLLMTVVPLVYTYLTAVRLFVLLFLVVSLWAKMTIEENMLLRKFPEYEKHLKRSWRLLPFIY